MNHNSIFTLLFGLTIALTATNSFSGEAEITLKHASAQPNVDRVETSGSEPLVPHYGSWEKRRIEPSTTNSSGKPKYGPVLKVKPQGFHGIEPDEID